jgi:hypothetical protein
VADESSKEKNISRGIPMDIGNRIDIRRGGRKFKEEKKY